MNSNEEWIRSGLFTSISSCNRLEVASLGLQRGVLVDVYRLLKGPSPKGCWQSHSMGDGEECAYSPAYIGAIKASLPLGRIGNFHFHWSCEEQGNTIVFLFS